MNHSKALWLKKDTTHHSTQVYESGFHCSGLVYLGWIAQVSMVRTWVWNLVALGSLHRVWWDVAISWQESRVALLCDLSASSTIAQACSHNGSRVSRERLEIHKPSWNSSELIQYAIGQSKSLDVSRFGVIYPYYSYILMLIIQISSIHDSIILSALSLRQI